MQLERRSGTAPAEQIIDLRQLFAVVWRAKWRILTFTFLCGVLAVFVLLNMSPLYRSTATLLIEAQQARAIKIDEVYGFNSAQQEFYLTQFEVLKSRTIAEEVFDILQVAQHPEYQPKPSKLAEFKQLLPFLPAEEAPDPELAAIGLRRGQLNKFVSNISINPIRRTQLVQISFTAEDPRLAQAVANAIGEAYMNSQLNARFGITQKANTWLGGRVAELRERLDESERRLEEFKADNGLVDVEGVTALDQRELENLNEQLTEARARKAETEGFLALVRRSGRNDISRLESLPEITSHISIQNVKREVLLAERKVAETSKVFGPKHPRMISAQAELAAVQQSLQQQILRLIDGVEKEAEAAAERLAGLEQRFAQVRSRFSGLGSLESDYRRLEREVETNRLLYDNFMARQKETEVTGDFDAPLARFTDLAILPTQPFKPNKKLLLLLVLVGSFGLGVVVTLIFDALNDTIKTPDDAEKLLKRRSLGFIPRVKQKLTKQQIARMFFNKEQRYFREAVSNIRTSVSLLSLEHETKVILVTSSVAGEGKTTVAINTGFAFSALERVLIIDADMRKPTLGEKLDIPAYQPGLANILAGINNLAECVVRDEESGIDILAAGAVPLNPLELLASEKMAELLTGLKEQYDRIIIDSPPVQAVSDALQLAPLTDAVIVVVKADHTRTPAIANTLARIIQAHGNVFGVVLNQMDVNKAAAHYGNYGYYGVYGENKTS
ncbi:GumC family protein [Alishewanella sp. d11]|uniref:GumC family protein n=1 Tax=Alishewanella sp. d11 TaxID=3414030 RepID=UPI003BF87F90